MRPMMLAVLLLGACAPQQTMTAESPDEARCRYEANRATPFTGDFGADFLNNSRRNQLVQQCMALARRGIR